jgi:hypothetical protein
MASLEPRYADILGTAAQSFATLENSLRTWPYAVHLGAHGIQQRRAHCAEDAVPFADDTLRTLAHSAPR